MKNSKAKRKKERRGERGKETEGREGGGGGRVEVGERLGESRKSAYERKKEMETVARARTPS